MVKLICQILFGHVVGFVSERVSPRNTKILGRFWRAMFYPFGGKMQGWKQHFGPRLGPSLGILGRICRASWAIGVVFKLSWAILFGHVVAFASRNAFPQQDQDFKWVSASYVGSIVPRKGS